MFHYGQIFQKMLIHLKPKIHLWLKCSSCLSITEADTNQVFDYFPGENTVRKFHNKVFDFLLFKIDLV
jgi:hypothetical protein